MSILPFLVLGILTVIPTLSLLKRTGLSRSWALLSALQLGMLIVLWLGAYASWDMPDEVGAAQG